MFKIIGLIGISYIKNTNRNFFSIGLTVNIRLDAKLL